MWDNAGGGCNVSVPNLPRREVGRAGVYWRALGRARLQEHLGGDWGLPRYCPFSSPKACCPTHSLLSVWDSAKVSVWDSTVRKVLNHRRDAAVVQCMGGKFQRRRLYVRVR